jgi:hypothetical protein
MARWQSAIVLNPNAAGKRLWQLKPSGDGFVVQSEKSLLASDTLPSGVATKDWKTLVSPKLNVALLPPDRVFLRAIQLPASDITEIKQMVELQMEKLSPLPVTHVLWSIYLLPQVDATPESLRTVIVIIAGRSAVEEYLGQLETQGFLADRLEAPGLDQLLALSIRDEGVWIVSGALGEPALVAWWFGNTLQNISFLPLSAGVDRGQQLKTQIEQIAWAGELEGWLTATPKIYLVATLTEARYWEGIFTEGGQEVNVIAPLSEGQLMARSAQRCGSDDSSNLLPPDVAKRYHQQFIDSLWIRGAFAVLGLYLVGVAIYFGALFMLQHQYNGQKSYYASLGAAHTNALKDSEQLKILNRREALKFAALDCWKAVAENLPESVSIEHLYFDHHKVDLDGSLADDDVQTLLNFNDALRTVPNPNKPDEVLFSEVVAPTISQSKWRFSCTLKNGVDE